MTTRKSATIRAGTIVWVKTPEISVGWHTRVVRECDARDARVPLSVSLASSDYEKPEPFDIYHDYCYTLGLRLCQPCVAAHWDRKTRHELLHGRRTDRMRVAFQQCKVNCAHWLGVTGPLGLGMACAALEYFNNGCDGHIVVPAEIEFDYTEAGDLVDDPGRADYVVKACENKSCERFDELISIRYRDTHLLVRRVDLWCDRCAYE